MDISVYLKGLILGLSIAAPVGPIGVLVIRRTLAEGRMTGLVSGLGAATADAVYGLIAALGITALINALTGVSAALKLVGGLVLLYLAYKIFTARPAEKAAEAKQTGRGLWGAYLSTIFLTFTSPATIFVFFSLFSTVLGDTAQTVGAAVVLVAGVASGSALWWTILSTGVGLFRAQVTPGVLVWVNRVSGVVIAGFGVAALLALGA